MLSNLVRIKDNRIIMTKLVRNGRHTRRISNEKHASNINIHTSIESVPHGVIWQNEAIGVFPANEICTGMKFVPVPEKSTKKRGLKRPLKFYHSFAIM